MKHPLTSKERRGLTAVAVAALLCIASGFIFRSCSNKRTLSDPTEAITTSQTDNPNLSNNPNKLNKTNKSQKSNKTKKSKKLNKQKKSYPTRDPLSQPCD